MVFPVIHSTLDPDALCQEIECKYDLPPPVRCRLMSRANNDFYEVTAGRQHYALRVTKANFRAEAEYLFEQAYVAHLHAKGCHVPAPVPAADRTLLFFVEAPEGVRSIALMRWLDGVPFTKDLTPSDAHDMGAALARLHLAGTGFSSAEPRLINTMKSLTERLPDLLKMLADRPDDCAFYEKTTQRLDEVYRKIDPAEVPEGPVHGDYQFANVVRLASGEIGMLDFDTCGVGYLAEDILTFVWRSDMEIGNEAVNQSFVEGYESVRPLADSEKRLLPIFRLARDLIMSVSYAMLINRVGPVSGFDGDFSPFTELARRHAHVAGLDQT